MCFLLVICMGWNSGCNWHFLYRLMSASFMFLFCRAKSLLKAIIFNCWRLTFATFKGPLYHYFLQRPEPSSSLLLFNYLLLLLWFYDLVFDLLNLVIYCISPFLGHFILLWITDLQSYMKSSAASTAMSLWWLFNSG